MYHSSPSYLATPLSLTYISSQPSSPVLLSPSPIPGCPSFQYISTLHTFSTSSRISSHNFGSRPGRNVFRANIFSHPCNPVGNGVGLGYRPVSSGVIPRSFSSYCQQTQHDETHKLVLTCCWVVPRIPRYRVDTPLEESLVQSSSDTYAG